MHMFGNEKITSYMDADGRLIVASTSEKSIVEYCPSTGATVYRRHQ